MARGRFLFWLNYDKDEELLVADMIDELKTRRQFTKSIRDGIRLVYDLRQGKVDVLRELFPHTYYNLMQGGTAVHVQPQTLPAPRVKPKELPQPVATDTKATGEFLNMFDDFG